jgi:diacylglycerol kinase (ATP)
MSDFTVISRIRSVRFALRGIRWMLLSQHNAWIHAAATLVAVTAGAIFRIDAHEWLVIVLAIMAVWTAEALNTAFEALCDVASPDFHPSVERAKDVAAGAVLISAIGSVLVAVLIFGPRVAALM